MYSISSLVDKLLIEKRLLLLFVVLCLIFQLYKQDKK